ncbi:citrate/2-methylcitrate synthase [Pseudonocardia alni]|uniref:citrate/2-methylcitrate synthase n=1 Tax=Pseudonocardia alni TaxID=33907 RepID=UPI00280B4F9A|nr:citrate/2-methylcitrate synthase [Pseudonocardia alni]
MTEARDGTDAELLTVDEVADLLGVQRRTVYAYVSRGQLTRNQRPGSRQSWFRRSDIEAMVRGDRAQQPGRGAPRERTELTSIVDGRLLYRGRDAVDLAGEIGFEQVAEWLWTGIDAAPAPWRQIASVPDDVAGFALPPGHLPLDRLKLTVSGLSAADPLRFDLSTAGVISVARSLLAGLARCLPVAPGVTLPSADAPIAAQLWSRLAPGRSHPRAVGLLDRALVLVADHGLAPSTRAARLAASVAADPYSVVLTGMGVASGLRHGGSSTGVHSLLEEIVGPERVADVLAGRLALGGVLPGFGQARYEGADPRAGHLLDELLADDTADPVRRRVVGDVLELVARRSGESPNVEFALGALCHVHGLVHGAGEVLFHLGRSAGWLAHALEERDGRT